MTDTKTEGKIFKSVSVPLLKGTTSGFTYIPFARNGKFVLGVKPNAIRDGETMGAPNTTYVGGRIRSAFFKAEHLQLPPDFEGFVGDVSNEGSNVIKLGSNNESFASAWPEVDFDKHADDRASGQVGVFLRGTFKSNPAGLIAQVENLILANKFVDYLVTIAGGEDNLIISKRLLRDWLDSIYGPQFQAMKTANEIQGAVEEEIDANIGQFGNQSSMLKKIQAAAIAAAAAGAVVGTPSAAPDDIDPDANDGDSDGSDGEDHGGDESGED